MNADIGNTMNTLADAPERSTAVVMTDKLQKIIFTVQIVRHRLNHTIIKTLLVVAPERNTAVAMMDKLRKKM